MPNLKQLIRLLDIVKQKGGATEFLRNKAFSVSSYEITMAVSKYQPVFYTILDVGANTGQFASAANYRFPMATIYSFEPVPETFQKLKRNISSNEKIKIFDFALGSTDSEIEFYQNEHSHASSALPISKLQKEVLPNTAHTKVIKVKVKKLEDIAYKLSLKSPTLLKIDVQGFEKEVLKGAGSFLDQVDYLLFETSFAEMYEKEPLFEEMHELVKSLGFKLVAPVGFLQSDDARILQLDMLYKR